MFVLRSSRFRFENVWIMEKECMNLVKNSWENNAGCDIMVKIQLCCLKLEEWGGGEAQKFRDQIKNCRYIMKQLRSRRDMRGV